jgi:hypothetical protein
LYITFIILIVYCISLILLNLLECYLMKYDNKYFLLYLF